MFVNGTSKDVVARLVRDLRARAMPRNILVFAGATVVVGRTAREAGDLLADYAAYASAEATLAQAAASLGIDFARYGMDEPIDASPGDAIRSNVEAMTKIAGPGWTKRRLLEQSVLGSRQPPIIGDPVQVADALQGWVKEADLDGFNLSRTVMPECLENFIDLVVPILQARGVYKAGYAPGTYREKLFAEGPKLQAPHPAAATVFWPHCPGHDGSSGA